MEDKRNNAKASTPTRRVMLAHAADIATLGDRWFVSLAGGLGMLGGRARRTAESAHESQPRRARSENRESAQCESRESAPSSQPRSQRFDVVSANHADSWSPLASGPRVREDVDDSEQRPDERAPIGGMHRAGVLPLLQALARVVAEHVEDDAGLADDERLWTLIQLLQALGGPEDGEQVREEEIPPCEALRQHTKG